MAPLLTTITAVWRRPEALRCWAGSVRAATCERIAHLLYCVNERYPGEPELPANVRVENLLAGTALSIGAVHNLGARATTTEWIMKLDVDTLLHARFFRELLPMLDQAEPRQWFNAGMWYLTQRASVDLDFGGLSETHYRRLIERRVSLCGPMSRSGPAGTNFVCRRKDYLDLGGCDERFRGYGWEDYQQIYMLERYRIGHDPLPGPIHLGNVTQRCRDELSRPLAWQLWQGNSWLSLIHRWHAPTRDPAYRASVQANRIVLLDWINRARALDGI